MELGSESRHRGKVLAVAGGIVLAVSIVGHQLYKEFRTPNPQVYVSEITNMPAAVERARVSMEREGYKVDKVEWEETKGHLTSGKVTVDIVQDSKGTNYTIYRDKKESKLADRLFWGN